MYAGRTYLGRRDLVIAVPEAGNGCPLPVCWAVNGLGVCSRSSSAVHSIAFRFGCSRFDSVPVLEWIVITGSLDWAREG